MTTTDEIEDAFPELGELSDDDLKDNVVRAWEAALAESDHESIREIPYLTAYADSIGERWLAGHVRDTTRIAIALVDVVETLYEEPGVDRDAVVAGALVHDVSKVLETPPLDSADQSTEIGRFLGHPHYAVHVLAAVDIPVSIQHIALAHSHQSGPGIQTIEGLIVWTADVVSLNTMAWDHSRQLSPSFERGPMGEK